MGSFLCVKNTESAIWKYSRCMNVKDTSGGKRCQAVADFESGPAQTVEKEVEHYADASVNQSCDSQPYGDQRF